VAKLQEATYRVTKMHRMPCVYTSFSAKEPYIPQKSPVIGGSFAERDLQLKVSYASSPSGTCQDILLVQPIAFGVSFFQSQISIDNLVHYVSFAVYHLSINDLVL